MKHVLLVILCSSVVVIGCTNDRSNVAAIPETTFVNYYTDWLILQEEAKISRFDSPTIQHKRDSLCQRYGVTQRQIDQTLHEHQQDLTAWRQFYDKVVKRLEQLQRLETTKPQPRI